jgi:hypothetical protein
VTYRKIQVLAVLAVALCGAAEIADAAKPQLSPQATITRIAFGSFAYRVAGPFAALNLGLAEIDWEATAGSLITLSAAGIQGRGGLEYRIALASLTARPTVSGAEPS